MATIYLILLTLFTFSYSQTPTPLTPSTFQLTPSIIGTVGATLQMRILYQIGQQMTVPNGATLTLTLPTGYTFSGTTCTIDDGLTITTCTYSAPTVSFQFTSSSNPFVLKVNVTGINLPKKFDNTAAIALTINNGATPLYKLPDGQSVLGLAAANMQSCALLTPSNPVVGQTGNLLLQLVTGNLIPGGASGAVKITIPAWSDSSTYFADGTTYCTAGNNANPSLSCSFSAATLTITNVVSTDTSGTVEIHLNNIKNPLSLAQSPAFSLQTLLGTAIQENCSSMKFSVPTPGAITGWGLSCSPSTVQTQAGCTVQFTVSTFIFGGNKIEITLPPEVSASTVNLVIGSPSSIFKLSFIYPKLTFSTSTSISAGTSILLYLEYFISAASTAATSSFSIKTYMTDSGTDYLVDQGLAGFLYPTVTTGPITVTSVTASPTTAGITGATYTFVLSFSHSLTANGGIEITFPSQISVPTCAWVSGSAVFSGTPACTNTGNIVTLKNLFSGAYSPSGPVTISISGMTNPKTTAQTSPFTIKTIYNTSIANSYVDADNAYKLTTITAGILNPATITIVPTTYVTSDYPMTYKFSFVNANPTVSSGSLIIKFPTGCLQFPSPITSVAPLTPSNINTFASISVTSGGGFDTFTVTNAFGTVSAGQILSFGVAGIKNPPTTAQCSGIQFTTFDNLGNTIDSTNLATLAMTNAHPYANVAINADTLQNGRTAKYTISLQLKEPHYTNDIISFNFPSPITLQASPSVTLQAGSQAGVSLGTAIKSGNSVSVSITTGSTIPSGAILNFLIQSVVNTQPSTSIGSITITTTDSLLNLREQSVQPTGLSTTAAIMTGPPSTLILSSYTRGQTGVIYTFNFQQWNLIPAGGYIEIVFPSDITAPAGTPACGGSGGATGISCATTGSTVKVTGTFSTLNSIINIPGVVNPIKDNSFPFTVFTYNNLGIVLDTLTTDLLYNADCDLPCMTCVVGQRATCTGCFTNTTISTNTLFQPTVVGGSTGTCTFACLTNQVNVSGTCVTCTSPCATCITSPTTCQTCITTPMNYLQGTTCSTTCTPGTYPDNSNQICKTCPTGCTQCTSATFCTACSGGNYMYNGACVSNCPPTYFNDVTNCTKCPAKCNTCTSLATCTSCNSPLAYYQGVCYTYGTCPSGLASNGTDCAPCNSAVGCASCYGSVTNCTSCTGGLFLSGGSCTTTCPPGTYTDSLANQCKPCDTTCATCNGAGPTACATCTTGGMFPYLLANGRCSATCPGGTYGDSSLQVCNNCDGKCSLCTGPSSSQCQACNSPNLYYALTTSCLTTCPIDITVAVGSVCTPCDPSCATCSGSILSCTSCPANMYHNPDLFQCSATCTPGRYISGSQCLKCASSCLTCQTSATNCLSCGNGNFLYAHTCSSKCPSGYYGNTTDNTCTNNNGTYIDPTVDQAGAVPFPFLISALIVFLGLAAAKASQKDTIIPSNYLAFLSLIELAAWITATVFLAKSYGSGISFEHRDMFFIALGIILNYIANLLHIAAVCAFIHKDNVWQEWRKMNNHNFVHNFFLLLSTITSFKLFRLTYSRLMGSSPLSAVFQNSESLKLIHWLTIATFIAANGSVILGAFLYLQSSGFSMQSQLAITCVEIPVLSFLVACCTVFDVNKSASFYDRSVKTPRGEKSKVLPLFATDMNETASVDKVRLDLNNSNQKLLPEETHEDVVATYLGKGGSARKNPSNLFSKAPDQFVETHENLLDENIMGASVIPIVDPDMLSGHKTEGIPPTPEQSPPKKLNPGDFHTQNTQIPVQSQFDEIKPRIVAQDFDSAKKEDHKIKKRPVLKPGHREDTEPPSSDRATSEKPDRLESSTGNPMEETVYATRQQLLQRVDSKRTSTTQTRQNSNGNLIAAPVAGEYWNTDRSAAADQESPALNDAKLEMIKPPIHISHDLQAVGLGGEKPYELQPEQMIIEKKIPKRKYLGSDEEETTSVDMKSTDLGSVIHYKDKFRGATDVPTSAIEEDLTENEEIIKRRSVPKTDTQDEEKSAEFATPYSKRSSGVLQNPLEGVKTPTSQTKIMNKPKTPVTPSDKEVSVKDNPYDLSLSFRKNNFFNDPSRTGTSHRYTSQPDEVPNDFETEFSKNIMKEKSDPSTTDLMKPKPVEIDFEELARENARKKALESRLAEEARRAEEARLAEAARMAEAARLAEAARKEPIKEQPKEDGYRKMKKQVQKTQIPRTEKRRLSDKGQKMEPPRNVSPPKTKTPIKSPEPEVSEEESDLRVSRDSLNQSVGNSKDMIHEDTPSNYNVLNQRFDESEVPVAIQRKGQFMTLAPDSLKNTLATPSSTVQHKKRFQYADEPAITTQTKEDGLPWNRRSNSNRRSKTMPKRDSIKLPKIEKKESFSDKKKGDNRIQGFKVFEADDTYSDFMKDAMPRVDKKKNEHTLPSISSKKGV